MIGILDAYHFDTTPGSYQEKYMPMTLDYLKKIMPDQEFKHYRVAINIFPNDIDDCDGYVVTGSPASCYEDLEWVNNLIEFCKKLHARKKKMFGICFGHQVIAHALGGEVVNSDKGWGLGVREFNIINNNKWMNPKLSDDHCSLIFFHQDQVTKLPLGGVQLATDPFCENQMYSIDDHVFCVQGHPEFTAEYAAMRTSQLVGRISEEFCNERVDSLKNEADDEVFGKWIKKFFES